VTDPLRVAALLSWYDEPPAVLERAIRSYAEIADHLVAVDGAYATFPGGEATSAPEQREAIERTAADCGLDLLLWQPADQWAGGEIEKRDRMYRLADVTGADWYVICDADFLLEFPYKTGVRAVQEDLRAATRRGLEVAKVTLVDYLTDDVGGDVRREVRNELPLFYRAAGLSPLHISETHYHTIREGSDTHLWGCLRTPQVEHFDMTDTVHVRHEWWHRDEMRQAAKWGYYVLRDANRLERSPFAVPDAPELGFIGETTPDDTLVAATAEEE
jgi:hypothetical protein